MHTAQTIYDAGCPLQVPDTSTPALAAVVAFEATIHRNALETGAFFDALGSIVVQRTGQPKRVKFLGPALNGTAQTTFTHNHPDDGSFSLRDVESAVGIDMLELRAVGPRLRYRMWPRVTWPSAQAVQAEVKQSTGRVAILMKHMVASGAIHPQYAQWEAEHQVWVAVANVLGLNYRRERAWP